MGTPTKSTERITLGSEAENKPTAVPPRTTVVAKSAKDHSYGLRRAGDA